MSDNPTKTESNVLCTLQNLQKNKPIIRIVTAYLNINSIRIKLDLLANIIKGNVDF